MKLCQARLKIFISEMSKYVTDEDKERLVCLHRNVYDSLKKKGRIGKVLSVFESIITLLTEICRCWQRNIKV